MAMNGDHENFKHEKTAKPKKSKKNYSKVIV